METSNLHNYDIMSYDNWSLLRSNFRKVDAKDSFRIYDEPGYFFWKPLFYFYNGDDVDNGIGSSGLLHPSWNTNSLHSNITDTDLNVDKKSLVSNTKVKDDVMLNNSAYNYLLRNDEIRRAALLKDFINLLSDISSKTPWYFKEISGLDEAISRKSFYESPKIEDTRKQLIITCLADSIDTRIGNMLDMYRAACFSWQTKREIVPANLRKFDMGIYIYLQPNQRNIQGKLTNVYHKYLEFHNCEIDIDSCKFGDAFSTEESRTMEYKIYISYDNCYDNRYSNNVLGLIGDAIITDMIINDNINSDVDGSNFQDNHKDYTGIGEYGEMYNSKLYSLKENQNDYNKFKNKIETQQLENKNFYGLKGYKIRQTSNIPGGFVSNLVGNTLDATVGVIEQAVRAGVGGLLLGNLYTGSLKNAAMDIYQGRVFSGGTKLLKTITNKDTYKLASKNLTEGLTQMKDNLQAVKDLGNLYKESKNINKIGKINKSKSIKNNI